MNSSKKDIVNRKDVELLVNKFYDKVKVDELLEPLFRDVDWSHHLPIMYNFWSSMLLADQSYNGNPLQKHLPLPLQPEHFQEWLKLFTQTLEENFTGDKAFEAKERAKSIALIFQHKMGLLSKF